MAIFNKDFVLLDESVVDYGYRCLMSGAELAEFKRNPVLLLMHLRLTNQWELPTDDVLLPIGKWVDIRVEGSQLLAKPEFDDDDPIAVKVEKKVQKGYLNAASVWVDPIAVSDDDNLKLPGQSGPTITKWGVRESSIVDIPGCRNAIVIRDDGGKLLKLNSTDKTDQGKVLEYLQSLIPNKNSSDMDRKQLCARLGLPETATDQQIDEKLSAAWNGLQNYTKVVGERDELKTKLTDLETAQTGQRAEKLVDDAIGAGKLAAGDRAAYLKLATADYETTKSLLDKMQAYQSLEQRLAAGSNTVDKAELEALTKLSGRELYMQGKFERLKALDPEVFKLKYKEYFKAEYKG